MERGWRGLPFITISEHYRKLFNGKVYKIPVSVVDDCPNRRGLKGMQTCVFCDEWGSAARSESLLLPLKKQIETYSELIRQKKKAEKFLVYFQAYTNTFTKISALRAHFEAALEYDFVKGFVVGTRPDCLSPAVLQLWQEFHEKSFVAVEIGVQSFVNEQLEFLRRGHTAEDSVKAIQKIAKDTKVDIGIHLMFGLPGETDQHIIEAAQKINDLPISNVKLHNLHVLKNTPLEEIYHRGEFTPIDREKYADRVRLFLQHLSPRVALHRLAAYSSRHDELVAPAWTSDKMATHQAIVDYLRKTKSFQSQNLISSDLSEQNLQQQLALRVEPLLDNLRS